MATGMEMLLGKMLGGLNPQAIQDQIQTAANHAQATIAHFQNQLNRIEANQQILYKLLLNAGLIESVESLNESKALTIAETENDGGRNIN